MRDEGMRHAVKVGGRVTRRDSVRSYASAARLGQSAQRARQQQDAERDDSDDRRRVQ